MPSFMQRPKIIIDSYEVLDFIIFRLNGHFESDAAAVYLTNVENFLIGKSTNSDYIACTYKDDVKRLRLT